MHESPLETQVRQSNFSRIADEFRQWREPQNRAYFDHYLWNALKIMFGYKPTDYRIISHENAVAHSFLYGIDDSSESKVSPGNRVVGATIYNPETGKFW